MVDRHYIRCPGCNIVVASSTAACPGCGRCLNCGTIRATKCEYCPDCELPYCDCCGRCPQCAQLRYADVGPCSCGHPEDVEKQETLIRRHAVVGGGRNSTPLGCVVTSIVAVVLLVLGLLGFFGLPG